VHVFALGPLPSTWIESQRDLQIQILAQMRSFGMTAVLPAFSGLVPPAFKLKYPQANVSLSSGWGDFPPTTFLEPTDPLFAEIQRAFLTTQAETYGTDHYYNCDLYVQIWYDLLTLFALTHTFPTYRYNEMTPLTNDTSYLSSSTAGVYNAMISADHLAKWVMQGWLFVSAPEFWQPPQVCAQSFLQLFLQFNM
jgi:alpha-N-acetylglucosaminidase